MLIKNKGSISARYGETKMVLIQKTEVVNALAEMVRFKKVLEHRQSRLNDRSTSILWYPAPPQTPAAAAPSSLEVHVE